ncbi:MAG: hypothetical protein V9F46_10955 [Chitinophagaceae bacterium]
MHLLVQPDENYIFLPGLKEKIISTSTIGGKTKVNFKQQPEGVFIYLDGVKLDDTDTIFQLTLK